MVESQSDDILAGAKDEDVSFLVVGDPFGWASLAILTSQPCAAQGDPGTLLSPSCRLSYLTYISEHLGIVARLCLSIFAGRPHIQTWSCELATWGYL